MKNENLNRKIIELQNQLNNNFQYNKILELENEIKKYKSYFLSPGEELITVKFISTDQIINFSITCKNTDKFTNLENILYDNYPKYKYTENFFLVNGIRINKYSTLKENKIKNNDVLTLTTINFDE